jgi:hypothetical protein
MSTISPIVDIAAILAKGYLRHLRTRAANQRVQAHLGPHDSSLTRCYRPPPE